MCVCVHQQATSTGSDLSSVFSGSDVATLEQQGHKNPLRDGPGVPVLVPFHTVVRLLVAAGTLGPGARERGATSSHHVAPGGKTHPHNPAERANSQVGSVYSDGVNARYLDMK